MSTKATLTFTSTPLAKAFASKWALRTLTGYDISAIKPDGLVHVTVYDITPEKKKFIDDYVARGNA